MSELMDFIDGFDGSEGILSLIHTTDKYTLKLIKESKSLKVDDDSVYPGEKLVYLFYGRPSFRVNSKIDHTTASFFAPICMIFDRSLMNQAFRIMPFDSGAHAAGMLDGTVHKKMDRANFELDVSASSPMKLIRCFYGSELSYLENEPHVEFPNVNDLQKEQKHHVEAYYHLVHHRSNSTQDERINAIELQFNKDIEISGNLKAVILPSRFYSASLIQEIESELNATAITYETPSKYRPGDLTNTIYEKVKNFISSSPKV